MKHRWMTYSIHYVSLNVSLLPSYCSPRRGRTSITKKTLASLS